MRALITGVTGFVGQYLAEHLIAAGDQVLGSSFRDTWCEDVATAVVEQVQMFEWNLAQPLPPTASQTVERFAPDALYHLAAISVPSECGTAQPSALAHTVNVEGTRRVVELARSLPRPPRVLVVSSSHVYAPVSPESPVVNERAPLGPTGAYGSTKLQAEEVARWAAGDVVPLVVTRAFQHSGPRQLPKFMLPEWARQFAASADEPIRVVTLNSHVDLSDVRDVVRAYRLLMAADATRGTYNVGSARSVCSRDVFEQLERLSGRRRDVIELSPGRRQHPIADISRLMRDTSWTPQIPLERTIADTLAFFQARAGKR